MPPPSIPAGTPKSVSDLVERIKVLTDDERYLLLQWLLSYSALSRSGVDRRTPDGVQEGGPTR